MRITFPKFGGLIPRLDPELLPDEAAQTATNCTLTTGRLVPIAVSGDVVQWHDETNRVAGIASGDFFQVTTPAAPTLSSSDRIFRSRLLSITEYVYVVYVDNTGELQVEEFYSFNMVPKRTQWTDRGCALYFSKRQGETRLFQNDGIVYRVYGPRYQVRLGNQYLPISAPTYSDPVLPAGQIPLIHPDTDEQYGILEAVDTSGPVFDEEIVVTDFTELTYTIPAHDLTITFDLNYTYPTRRTFYYAQSKLGGGSSNYEGPVSDYSDPIVVEPGMEVTLNVVYPGKLYRSETGGDDFLLIENVTTNVLEAGYAAGAGEYIDRKALTLGEVIPPYGDYPTGASRNGSVVHPAGFGVIYYTNTVYPSDYAKHSTYPEEWTIEFPTNIMALEIAGGSIIVWTAASGSIPGKVFALLGSDPSSLSKVELSATEPLLDARSICKLGQRVFYVSTDGLVQVDGGGTQLVTEPFYTRIEWSALTPANFKSKVAESSIFLYGSTTNLRIDMDEDLIRVTVWTALTGVSLTWKSKLFVHSKPWRPQCLRVRAANYPVTIKLYSAGSGSATATITASDGGAIRLGRYRPERLWEVQIESAYAVDEVILGSSMEELRGA
jgi:hypothetical protein